jgi:cysteinyl-tRNA synthetase
MFSGENDILSKAYSPAVVRFFMLQAHYRNMLDLSEDALQAAEKGYKRMMDAIKLVDNLPISNNTNIDIDTWIDSLYEAMNDDFNTPILIANLFEGVKIIHQLNEQKATITASDKEKLSKAIKGFSFEVLGLHQNEQNNKNSQQFDKTIQLLIDIRDQARADKNWALSDKVRDELAKFGVQLKDGKDGTTYSFI